jgi:hypothetical protein
LWYPDEIETSRLERVKKSNPSDEAAMCKLRA